MVRTIREHERATARDQTEREAERRRSHREQKTAPEDPTPNEPAETLITASLPPDASGDDLKCERVQDRGPDPCDGEG